MPADTGPAPDAATLGHWLDKEDAPGRGEQPVLELLTGGSRSKLYRVHRDERMVLQTAWTWLPTGSRRSWTGR